MSDVSGMRCSERSLDKFTPQQTWLKVGPILVRSVPSLSCPYASHAIDCVGLCPGHVSSTQHVPARVANIEELSAGTLGPGRHSCCSAVRHIASTKLNSRQIRASHGKPRLIHCPGTSVCGHTIGIVNLQWLAVAAAHDSGEKRVSFARLSARHMDRHASTSLSRRAISGDLKN